LETEIHLHNFNNKKQLEPEKQKKWAAKNFERISELKLQIDKELANPT
jgi:hypothetical protein